MFLEHGVMGGGLVFTAAASSNASSLPATMFSYSIKFAFWPLCGLI